MLRMLLVALFVVSPACKKVSDKKKDPELSQPVSASRPVGQLGDVVATLQLDSGTKSADLEKIFDNFQPGASAMLAAQLPPLLGMVVGVELSADDLSGPIAIVVVNPEKHSDPAAVLIKSANAKTIGKRAKAAGKGAQVRDGWVLVGAPATVAACEAFAFANLSKPSAGLVAVAYPAPLVKAYQKRFDDFTTQVTQTMSGMGDQGPLFGVIMEMYKEMFSALGEQSERLVLTVGTAGKSSEIYFRLYPKAGTTVESFVQAQVVADHRLLPLLPHEAVSNMIFSGEMRAGAARDAIFNFSVRITGALYGQDFGDSMKKSMLSWFEAFDGGFAATMSMDMAGAMPQMSMSYLMGSTDPDKMRKGWRELMTTFAAATDRKPNMAGMKFDVDFQVKASEYDGVEVDYYATTIDQEGMDPAMAASMAAVNQKLYIAAFDKVAAMSMATEGKPGIEKLIDAARGKSKGFSAKGIIAEEIARSKKRKESLVMVFDMAELIKEAPQPPPFKVMSMGLGKESDGALLMRMSVSP